MSPRIKIDIPIFILCSETEVDPCVYLFSSWLTTYSLNEVRNSCVYGLSDCIRGPSPQTISDSSTNEYPSLS